MGAALRCLVVEGNVRAARETHARETGRMPCEAYSDVLGAVAGGLGLSLTCDLAFPADAGADLPDPAGLEAYDAVVLTGSALAVYEAEPAVTRQVALMRAVYASGTPSFGSCWGLQVATVAAGGTVAPCPAGPEIGFARRIAPTEAGRGHPLLAGRPAAFDAPAVHLDAVTVPAPGSTTLAANDVAPVQAAEIRVGAGTFWGVQYHPEFALDELAAIVARYGRPLVRAGLCRAPEEAAGYAADLAALHADPGRADLAWRHGLNGEVLEADRRLAEIRNFVEHRVLPERSRRLRA